MARYSVDIVTKVDFSDVNLLESKIKNLQTLGKQGVNLTVNSKGLQNIPNQAGKVGKQASASFNKGFNFRLNTKGFDADLANLNSKINKFSTLSMSNIQKNGLNSTRQTLSDLNAMLDKFKHGGKIDSKDMAVFSEKLKTAQNEVRILSSDLSGMSTSTQRLKAIANMEDWLNKNTKATRSARKDVKSYIKFISDNGDKLTSGGLKEVEEKFKNVNSDMKIQGKLGRSFMSEAVRGVKAIGQFALTYGGIHMAIAKVGESVKELKEIDTILTEISKTSDLTETQLKQLGETSFESASKFGKKASDYLIGVQEMSRSGFYGRQAEELAQLSILGQAAGDMSVDVSNAYLLATNAAYEYQGSVQKLNAVLDGQNMINIVVMPYRNIWLHSWLLSWKLQRWTIRRIS